jgi:hypothetical protein
MSRNGGANSITVDFVTSPIPRAPPSQIVSLGRQHRLSNTKWTKQSSQKDASRSVCG